MSRVYIFLFLFYKFYFYFINKTLFFLISVVFNQRKLRSYYYMYHATLRPTGFLVGIRTPDASGRNYKDPVRSNIKFAGSFVVCIFEFCEDSGEKNSK